MTIRIRRWVTSKGEARKGFLADRGKNKITGKREKRLFQTREDARQWLRAVTAHPSGKTLTDILDPLIAKKTAEGLERSTTEYYRGLAEHHIIPYWGARDISTITGAEAEAFLDHLIKTISRAMVSRVLFMFKHMLDAAVKKDWLKHNPATAVKLASRSRERKRIGIPTRAEIHGILAALKVKKGRKPVLGQVLIPTIIFTGLRNSEWRDLRWPDVHLDARPAFIRVQHRVDKWGVSGSPKSEAGTRDVNIPGFIAELLRAWAKVCPKGAKQLVFPNGDGEYQNHANIHERIWRPLQVGLGLTRPKDPARISALTRAAAAQDPSLLTTGRYRLHDLRHAFASILIDAGGIDPKEIQRQMGHGSLGMTMDTYGHLWKHREKDLARVRKIEEWARAS